MTTRSFLPATAIPLARGCVTAASALVAAVSSGCPHPADQFQDYLSSTADRRSQVSTDASIVGSADAKAPTEPIQGTYLATCITALSNDETRVLRFYSEVTFVPEGNGGKLTLKMTAFKGWDAVAGAPKVPASFSKSETVGSSINANDVPVVGAQFTANLGTIDVLGEANTISGRQITLDPVIMQGLIDGNAKPPAGSTSADAAATDASAEAGASAGGTGSFCAGLGGSVTKPIQVTLAASDGSNICLFRYQKEGEPLILHKMDDFKKSPCAPPTPDGG